MDDDARPASTWEGRTAAEWAAIWRREYGAAPPVLHLYESVGSTNDIARHLAERGEPNGTTVIADLQTRGRGRLARRWHAPPRTALLLSTILRVSRPLEPDDAPGTIPLRVGLAAARAIDRRAATTLQVKWPNDLLANGAKIAGILCEAAFAAQGGGYVVVGIGLNVNQNAVDLRQSATNSAISLRLLTGSEWDRGELAGAILAETLALADRLTTPFDDAELAEFEARDPLRGQLITVDGEVAGTAGGMARDGALRIIGHDGQSRNLRHGTVRTAVRQPHHHGMSLR